jgi:hypothetical protein
MNFLTDPIMVPPWAFFIFVAVWIILGLMMVKLRGLIRNGRQLQKRIENMLEQLDAREKREREALK